MRVSIITVCYNAAAYIEQTIESVLGQDYRDLEYVLVDGGSNDGTLEIIKRYQVDLRLQWVSEADEGISDAMNKGVAMASGDLIAHLNADDYYADEKVVSKVVECFKAKPETLWLTAGFNFISAAGRFVKEIRVRRYSFRRLLRGNIILHPATFIKCETFLSLGGMDKSLNYCMDYDLFLRLGRCAPPLLLDEQLTCFRAHDDSRSFSGHEQAYAEEYRVRMKYLRQFGRWTWFYVLDHQIKKRLNRFFHRRVLAVNREGS